MSCGGKENHFPGKWVQNGTEIDGKVVYGDENNEILDPMEIEIKEDGTYIIMNQGEKYIGTWGKNKDGSITLGGILRATIEEEALIVDFDFMRVCFKKL